LLIWVESTASIANSAGSATNATSVGIVPNSASIQDTAINAAIEALPNGGSLYFPVGQYLVSALTISGWNVGLILLPCVWIKGNG
jgi:polygalacturonase